MAVSNEFCMAGPAFHISIQEYYTCRRRYPSMARSYLSNSLSRLILIGPNISSGVEKRDIRYSKAFAPFEGSLQSACHHGFGNPGGPSKRTLSPASAANNDKPNSVSFS